MIKELYDFPFLSPVQELLLFKSIMGDMPLYRYIKINLIVAVGFLNI